MHKTPSSLASRIFFLLGAGALLLLAGCKLVITNLTPDTVPANPSQIYTITARFEPKGNSILRDSIQPRIIIDGQSHNMTKAPAGIDLWEFEYQVPAGRPEARYYFIAEYTLKSSDGSSPQSATSELQTLNIAGRYVLRPEANRAPVGSRVTILGAGFSPADIVYFNETPARTVFDSSSSLGFFVPAVEASRSYSLRVSGGGPELSVGAFRVDAISFQVFPSALSIRTGEQQAITFTIPQPAPAGGMLVDITTDIPESIIMPEILISAGSTSITVPVQGGKPGSGSLFYKSSAGEGSIPLVVTR